jgi:hypothetical protein
MYYNTPVVYRDHSPFWESFTWKFVESTLDNLGSVVDFFEFQLPMCSLNPEFLNFQKEMRYYSRY